MPLRTFVGLAIVALPALISAAAGQTDPLSGRLTSPTDSLCFSRD